MADLNMCEGCKGGHIRAKNKALFNKHSLTRLPPACHVTTHGGTPRQLSPESAGTKNIFRHFNPNLAYDTFQHVNNYQLDFWF
jgi:hypothetical protein